MSEGVSLKLSPRILLVDALVLFLCFQNIFTRQLDHIAGYAFKETRADALLPKISPTVAPQPFLPFLAPSPLSPFTNSSVPKLSGLCHLNFSAAESLLSITATDCWAAFAPLLANVICCPQMAATLLILVGQSSKYTGVLALNSSFAKPCLSDIEQVLIGQGAGDDLQHICAIQSTNLTEGSCPVKYVHEFESIVDTTELLHACRKIDPVKECCDQVCQSAIMDAAIKISQQTSEALSIDGSDLSEQPRKVNDCKTIVLRWLASKLDPSGAKEVLRGLTNCNVNKVCPLVFPNMRHVTDSCGNETHNETACCKAMENYVSHLQKQTLVTNLQALDCATSLGLKLQQHNITENIYTLCHISLKDFSLQVGNQVSGCLLPSMPSDATFDKSSGISFICDLNDNIPAPWPSLTHLPASSCDKSVRIPALPAATSGKKGVYIGHLLLYMLLTLSISVGMIS